MAPGKMDTILQSTIQVYQQVPSYPAFLCDNHVICDNISAFIILAHD